MPPSLAEVIVVSDARTFRESDDLEVSAADWERYCSSLAALGLPVPESALYDEWLDNTNDRKPLRDWLTPTELEIAPWPDAAKVSDLDAFQRRFLALEEFLLLGSGSFEGLTERQRSAVRFVLNAAAGISLQQPGARNNRVSWEGRPWQPPGIQAFIAMGLLGQQVAGVDRAVRTSDGGRYIDIVLSAASGIDAPGISEGDLLLLLSEWIGDGLFGGLGILAAGLFRRDRRTR